MEKFEQLHAHYYKALCDGYFAEAPDMAPTGFKDLDNNMGGYRWGDFVFVASRPGMGASTFLFDSAMNLAKVEGYKVGLVSLIRSQQGLNEDVMTRLADLPYRAVWESQLTEETLNTCYLDDELKQIPLHTWVPDTLDFDKIINQLEAYIDRFGLQYVIIDDFDSFTMSQRDNYRNKHGIAFAMCRQLHMLATQKKIVLITSARLSNAVDKNGPAKPNISHLSHIGNIRPWIQKVLFLYRPAYYGIEFDDDGLPTNHSLLVQVDMSKTGYECITQLYTHYHKDVFRITDQPPMSSLITEDWQYSLHKLLAREEELKKRSDTKP